MLKLMNDATVRAWEHSPDHPILAGAGARICVQALSQDDRRRLEESVLRPTFHEHYLDGIRATIRGTSDKEFEFNFDQPACEVFPWDYRLGVRLDADEFTLHYQMVLSRKRTCTGPNSIGARFGILLYFANHHADWRVYQGEFGRADQTNDHSFEGTMFNPKDDEVRLETERGTIIIGGRSGFDGIFLKADKAAGTVCLAPIAGYSKKIELRPGEFSMVATTINYIPRS